MIEGKIHGVKFKPMRVFADDRGILMEVLRDDDALLERFGQTTYTMSYPGTIKAFHWHNKQDDLWFVATGMAQVVLHDLRKDSPTQGITEVYCMGEHRPGLLLIPMNSALLHLRPLAIAKRSFPSVPSVRSVLSTRKSRKTRKTRIQSFISPCTHESLDCTLAL